MSFQNPVFIPGPTNIPESVRRACDLPTIDHRSSVFADILQPALSGVRRVMKGERAHVFVFPASGTGGWETALTNTLSPGDTVLAARNGMFSHRWIEMCQKLGLRVEVIETAWGDGLSAEAYGAALAADTGHRIKAVLATHNETATGVLSDVAAIGAAIQAAKHPALFFVDGVSSIGSVDFRFDDWGVDIAVTGSQKGFMLPAGLAILAVSDRAMAAADTARLPRAFFDLRDMGTSNARNGYPYTPSVGLLNGLKFTTQMLLDEGLDNVFARHARIAGGVRAAVAGWGMTPCANRPEWYSETVTAIRTPAGFDSTKIVTHASDTYGVAFDLGTTTVVGTLFDLSTGDEKALRVVGTKLEVQFVSEGSNRYQNKPNHEHHVSDTSHNRSISRSKAPLTRGLWAQ
jgi:alanine-glyoxylate transaminase/serine-glyoxylate transaminase/serine-pyruvate transaminase